MSDKAPSHSFTLSQMNSLSDQERRFAKALTAAQLQLCHHGGILPSEYLDERNRLARAGEISIP